MKTDLIWNSKLLFLGVPVAIFAFPHLFLITGGYETLIMPNPREYGFVENATALFFLLAGGYALYLAVMTADRDTPLLVRAALLLISAGAVFVCLEEISYGQHFYQLSPSGMVP